MSKVILKNIYKHYGEHAVVKDVSLEVRDKEFCVLVGPSGCGKTTILRMIAGLEEITDGEIILDDTVINDIHPKDRDIAMVFQNYALYPHFTVYENMAAGLRVRKYSEDEINKRIQEAARVLSIEQLLGRLPLELSGGQKQRVAVGRAICRMPKVFLFDEPLSNLDAKLRVQMRAELKKLHRRLEATIIYVTHDQVEAMTLGSKIVVMKDAVIQQVGDPMDIYEYPVNKFVAGFIGSPPMNFMEMKVGRKNGSIWLDEGKFELKASAAHSGILEPYMGKQVIFGIRPENIHDKLYSKIGTAENVVNATVDLVEVLGSEKLISLSAGKMYFTMRVDVHNQAQMHQDIDVIMNMEKAHIFDKETQQALTGK
ncbi:MAG: sn-glycerol-3-phosphate ABC transporter ATP-binding protein UgpC [Elusimicrobiota bacterium]